MKTKLFAAVVALVLACLLSSNFVSQYVAVERKEDARRAVKQQAAQLQAQAYEEELERRAALANQPATRPSVTTPSATQPVRK